MFVPLNHFLFFQASQFPGTHTLYLSADHINMGRSVVNQQQPWSAKGSQMIWEADGPVQERLALGMQQLELEGVWED